MPLYDATCREHGTFEVLAKAGAPILCVCGAEAQRELSAPAKMATLWSGGWRQGLGGDGFFSHSAGQRVSDKREEERIMHSRGKINVKDLGGEAFEASFVAGKQREKREHDALVATYTDNLKTFGGDKTRAVTETFPAKAMLEQAATHDAKESA
jgi:hypothetical protein